jgi:hypothetical protein
MVLTAKTEKTIIDKTVLLKELKKAKARQYAMSEEEYLPGLITISAPLFDPLTGKGVGAVCFDFSVLQHSADDVEAKYGPMKSDKLETVGAAGAVHERRFFTLGHTGLFYRCLQLLAARPQRGGHPGLPVRQLRQVL